MIRKFGAVRDVHDVRDRMYRASRLAPSVPQRVDLREWGGPIKDQGQEGSCTGHAFSSKFTCVSQSTSLRKRVIGSGSSSSK